MGEQQEKEGFHLPQQFLSQRSPLLPKARYLEETLESRNTDLGFNQEMDSFEPSDFLCLNDDSDASSGENQQIFFKPTVSSPSPLEGRRVPSTCTISSPITESEQSSITPPLISRPTPSNPKQKKTRGERPVRCAFKTRSKIDILEDGYKWRKYGKKIVKNSPNPRNYYRCSYSNCTVKKRIERDAEDEGIVITTYEGKHNHESPTVVYYIGQPSIVLPQHRTSSCTDHSPSPLSYNPHYRTDFMLFNTT